MGSDGRRLDRLAGAAGSLAYIDQLYSDYANDPSQVDSSWQDLFSEAEGASPQQTAGSEASGRGQVPVIQSVEPETRIYRLIEAYRTYGHLEARVNPIATQAPAPSPQLDLARLGFEPREMSAIFPTCGLWEEPTATLQEIVTTLRRIYCNRIGFEYMGLQRPDLEAWLQDQLEPGSLHQNLTIDQKRSIFQHLNKSELFEVFLHTKYPGQKRFSLEGAETLIPIVASIIETGADLGLDEFIVGMAHRGRLNVLSNILNKSYQQIFGEFEDTYLPETFFEGSGDVKYHKGFSAKITTPNGKEVSVELPANPSHLEAVNTVVEGIARAREIKIGDDVSMQRVLPMLIHGDAAIAGQGVVYECLQLYDLPGYRTGGTIHMVINNQIGFTTLPKDGRSTRYCTDIARTFSAPVFHVNAEDPEGCVYAANLAVAMRQKFHCDVFIELNGWRKYGHNEGDEPAFTQPKEYQIIRGKRYTIQELYCDNLVHQGVMERQMAEEEEKNFRDGLQQALGGIQDGAEKKPPTAPALEKEAPKPVDMFLPVKTAVSAEELQRLAQRFCSIPEGFNGHSKLGRLLKNRLKLFDAKATEKVMDWGMAEHLAFASLLAEGCHVRLSGQDSRRGTFSHRHAMWIDQKTAEKYFPLSKMMPDQGRFDVFNSPLSEYGVLGFEFGYSLAYPEALVLWEAQFGDFSNGAQIIIDQFIATSEQKWGRNSPLVLLLPHGYEGQGPEHSSARMERFLQLAGDDNMFIVNASTPAQLFHLLRRQVLRHLKKPLIVFTPKGLLRHPACVSSLDELSKGTFEEVIDDPQAAKNVKRIVFCCGRVYYDIKAEAEKHKDHDLAIVRIDQLYPLHLDKIAKIIKKYKGAQEFIWMQEEPSNMGAWHYIRPLVKQLLPKGKKLQYNGRDHSASPATGKHQRHRQEYEKMMQGLFATQAKSRPSKSKAKKVKA